MACALTQGFTETGCKPGPGGIKEVLFCEIAGKNTETVAAGAFSAIDLQTDALFRRYVLNYTKGRATWKDTEVLEGGTVSYKPRVEIDLTTLATADRQEAKLLALNTLMIIVKTGSDEYIMLGYYNGMDKIEGGADGGKPGEWKGLKMVFEGHESEPALSVPANLIASLLVASS